MSWPEAFAQVGSTLAVALMFVGIVWAFAWSDKP
jgi:hypothetical protein